MGGGKIRGESVWQHKEDRMTEPVNNDSSSDNELEDPFPTVRPGHFEDLIGLFPECDDEFRRVIMEQRKAWGRKDPL